MTNLKRATIIILSALLCAAALLLSSCNGGTGSDTGTLHEDSTAAPSGFFIDGEYRIVRPDGADNTLVNAVVELRRAIAEKCGLELTISDDWLKPGDEPAAKEILIGLTNRPESESGTAALPLNGYSILPQGEKIVVCARSKSVLLDALVKFAEVISEQGSIPEEGVTGSSPRPVTSITINGKKIEEFQIVYQSLSLSDAASAINSYVADLTGAELPVRTVKNAADAPKLILGVCGLGEEDISGYGTDGYCVTAVDGGVCFTGKLSESVLEAFNRFAAKYLDGTGDLVCDLPTGRKLVDAPLTSRDDYIADPSLFPTKWSTSWRPSEALLDYNAKIASLSATDKNHVFTVSHRGDYLRYPENSIEALISVWKMGGDCVEIDLHFTKDGVAVLLHDDTLTRTTNCDEFIGKAGYPSSADVSEWTFEQLRALNLKAGKGGSSAALTRYVIPTLEEALIASKGRFFLIPDKQALWRYCEIPGIQQNSVPNYLYPLMKKTGNFESILISYGTLGTAAADTFSATQALQVQKYIYDDSGVKPFFFLRGWTSRKTADPYASALEKNSLTNSAIIVNGAFDPTNLSVINSIKNLVRDHPGTMFGGWTIDTDGYDAPETWEKMYSTGLRSIMTNNILALVQFSATKIGG